jgi:quinol monooxygenase YgiN
VRERLGPLLVSPCDERLHDGLSIGPAPTSVPGATYVLTHADAVPPAKDDAVRLLTELAEASRREDGNVRFDVLQQQSRKNHLTLLEAWSDTRAREAHVLAAHTRRFRAEFQAMSGSLYDERLYAALD